MKTTKNTTMKKYTLVATLAASAFICVSCTESEEASNNVSSSKSEEASNNVSSSKSEEASNNVSSPKSEEELIQEWGEQIVEFAQTVAECDSSNADSKAKDLQKIAARHNDTKAELEKLRPGEPQTIKQLCEGNEALETRVTKAFVTLFGTLRKLEQADYYGSSELEEAVKFSRNL